RLRWRLAIHTHEERLNHERPHARRYRYVVQYLPKRNRRSLDKVVILVGARFKLGPNLAVVLIEDRQPTLHMRPVKHAGVGDENHFEGGVWSGEWGIGIRISGFPTPHSPLPTIRFCLALHPRTGRDQLIKVLIRRRLSVAGECDVVEPAKVSGYVFEF